MYIEANGQVSNSGGRALRRARLVALGIVAVAVSMTSASLANAEEPLRLLLSREAPVSGSECIRGTLLIVRSFDQPDVSRGVRIGDIVEMRAGGGFLASGLQSAAPRDDDDQAWRIELGVGVQPMTIRAAPSGSLSGVTSAILLGRAGGDAYADPCVPADVRLEDGEALMRRLRGLYASPSNERLIEVMITP